MKLGKPLRKKLMAGETVEFEWPAGLTRPHVGSQYKVETESKKASDRELEIRSVKGIHPTLVTAILVTDPIRLLARGSGYTNRPSSAIGATDRQHRGNLWDEPEGVDDLTERRFTAEARAKDRLAAQELALAVEDVRAALKARIDESPDLRKMAGRSYYRISAELDRMVRNAKRRAA